MRTRRGNSRTFGGKRFTEYSFESSKQNANDLKEKLKANGMLVRVIKVKSTKLKGVVHGYIIYYRKK